MMTFYAHYSWKNPLHTLMDINGEIDFSTLMMQAFNTSNTEGEAVGFRHSLNEAQNSKAEFKREIKNLKK